MRKSFRMVLAISLTLALIFSVLVPVSGFAADPTYAFYVAVDGNDENPGTIDAPFATPERARDAIRELKANGGYPDSGVTVYFRGGDYSISSTFELNAQDSGTLSGPNVYKAYPGETVTFMGGKTLDASKFVPISDDNVKKRLKRSAQSAVLQLSLPEQGITDYGEEKPYGFAQNVLPAPMELFLGDKALTVARYPNEGFIPMGEVIDPGTIDSPGSFISTYDDIIRWAEPEKAWASGCFAAGYTDNTVKIASVDQDGKVTLSTGIYGNIETGSYYCTHFYYNVLEELDNPGEYYVDTDNGILYLYPTEDYLTSKMYVSMLEEPIVAIEDASYVNISGINFEGTRGMGIYMEKGEHNQILDCTFKNMGNVAISIGKSAMSPNHVQHQFPAPEQLQSRIIGNVKGLLYETQHINREGGFNHVIEGCTIYNMGSGGIIAGSGDRINLIPSNIKIVNNEIHDVNRRDKTYKPPIWLDGMGIQVAHNKIYNIPSMAIHIMGNDHIIEYNEIFNCVTNSDDMGAIYAGRNPSELGNVIRYNYFHDNGKPDTAPGGIGQQSIFWDDQECNVTIFGNLFVRAGHSSAFKTNQPTRYNTFENNVLVDSVQAIEPHNGNDKNVLSDPDYAWPEDDIYTQRLKGPLNVFADNYLEKYPFLKEIQGTTCAVNVARNNVLVNTPIGGGGWTIEKNFEGDPKFVDAANGNYRLAEDSPVFTELPDFVELPIDLMGRYNSYVDQKAQGFVSLFVGNPGALAWGTKTYVDPNNLAVKPQIINDRTLVPVRFISETFGGEVGWDESTSTVTINMAGKEIKLQLNSNIMTVNGEEIALEVPAQSIEGRTLIPLRALCEQALGKNVFWDARGLIVISDNAEVFDTTYEGHIIDEVINRTIVK